MITKRNFNTPSIKIPTNGWANISYEFVATRCIESGGLRGIEVYVIENYPTDGATETHKHIMSVTIMIAPNESDCPQGTMNLQVHHQEWASDLIYILGKLPKVVTALGELGAWDNIPRELELLPPVVNS